jgi:hypothetical protein
VRRSFRADSCCGCAIFNFRVSTAFDTIVNSVFNLIFNPVLDSNLAPEECYNQRHQKEEQLVERGPREAQA